MVILPSVTKIIYFVLNGQLTKEKKKMTKGLSIITNWPKKEHKHHHHQELRTEVIWWMLSP